MEPILNTAKVAKNLRRDITNVSFLDCPVRVGIPTTEK